MNYKPCKAKLNTPNKTHILSKPTGQNQAANAVKGRKRMPIPRFLRAYDLKTTRDKLLALYTLNVSDALLTYLLVRTGCFCEANFLLRGAVFNFGELFLIKILLPAVLIAWLYVRICRATERQLRIGNIAVNVVLLLYTFINILHLVGVGTFLALEFLYLPSLGYIG